MSNAKKWSLAVFLAASALVSARNTQAAHRPQPGLVCVEQGDSSPEITYEFFGAMRNGSNQQWILCPVVRFNSDVAMNVTDWDISVDRRGSSAAWTVTLWSTNSIGTSGVSSTITVPGAPLSGAQPLDGGTFFGGGFAEGLLFVETFMPAGAEIRRVTVNEI